jgi:hypothetical protein
MKRFVSLAFALSGLLWVASAIPASAQMGPNGVPMYNSWQSNWDTNNFDRHHVILGVVVAFRPYRLQVQRPNGRVQSVDLKRGTIILPDGATPGPGQRVALIGYYSAGIFVCNRVILR